MTILERQRAIIETLQAENIQLRQKQLEMETDIKTVVSSIKTLWTATGIDLTEKNGKQELSFNMAMMPKILKLATDKGFKDKLSEEITNAQPILSKYQYLIEEK